MLGPPHLDAPAPAGGPLADRAFELFARSVMVSIGALAVVGLLLVLIPVTLIGVGALVVTAAWLWARARWSRLTTPRSRAGIPDDPEGRHNVRVRVPEP